MPKLDFSKPDQLQTRDGRQVRIYATDGMGTYCIHGAIKTDEGWIQERWDSEGANYHSRGACDLVRKPARVTGWVNVYPDLEGGFSLSNVFESRDKAEKLASSGCLVQIYIDVQI